MLPATETAVETPAQKVDDARDLSDPRWEENTKALAEAEATLTRAFGRWDRATKRRVQDDDAYPFNAEYGREIAA